MPTKRERNRVLPVHYIHTPVMERCTKNNRKCALTLHHTAHRKRSYPEQNLPFWHWSTQLSRTFGSDRSPSCVVNACAGRMVRHEDGAATSSLMTQEVAQHLKRGGWVERPESAQLAEKCRNGETFLYNVGGCHQW